MKKSENARIFMIAGDVDGSMIPDQMIRLAQDVLLCQRGGVVSVARPDRVMGYLNRRLGEELVAIDRVSVTKDRVFMIDNFVKADGVVEQRVSYAKTEDIVLKVRRMGWGDLPEANFITLSPMVTCLDKDQLAIEFFEQSNKIICQYAASKNEFKIFDMGCWKYWKYENSHLMDKVKFIDALDYTLMIGINNQKNDSEVLEYKLAVFDQAWSIKTVKKLYYSSKAQIEWVTTVRQYAWIIFSNLEMIVFDLKNQKSNKLTCKKTLKEIPVKIEVEHCSGRIVCAMSDSIDFFDAQGQLLAVFRIEAHIEMYDFSIVDDLPIVLVLCKTQNSPRSQGNYRPPATMDSYSLKKVQFWSNRVDIVDLELFPDPVMLGSKDIHLLNCRGGLFLSNDKGQVMRLEIMSKASQLINKD